MTEIRKIKRAVVIPKEGTITKRGKLRKPKVCKNPRKIPTKTHVIQQTAICEVQKDFLQKLCQEHEVKTQHIVRAVIELLMEDDKLIKMVINKSKKEISKDFLQKCIEEQAIKNLPEGQLTHFLALRDKESKEASSLTSTAIEATLEPLGGIL